MGFDDLTDMAKARTVLDRASKNFGADDPETGRYAAFAQVCVSEAAKRLATLPVREPVALFETYLSFWKAIDEGEQPPPPPPHLTLIPGGKS